MSNFELKSPALGLSLQNINPKLFIDDFVDNNASTTETVEHKQTSEDIEETEEEEEGMDGVSSEGEKTSGGNETLEVNI